MFLYWEKYLNNKKILSLFVLSFVAPLLLAFTLLRVDWSPSQQVNNGEFLTQQVTLNEWQRLAPKQWSIVQNTTPTCLPQCIENQLHMQQIANALGKYKDKVDLVLLGNSNTVVGFKNYPLASNSLKINTLYLVDRFGLVVLAYPLSNNSQQNQQIKRGLIKDLNKLFKFARSA